MLMTSYKFQNTSIELRRSINPLNTLYINLISIFFYEYWLLAHFEPILAHCAPVQPIELHTK